MTDFSRVQSLCYILDGLLTPENIVVDDTSADSGGDQSSQFNKEKELIEMYFVFGVVWALAGATIADAQSPVRTEFR